MGFNSEFKGLTTRLFKRLELNFSVGLKER